jgi:cutinase
MNKGADDIVQRITSQSQACPSQKFALAGYSQGARAQRTAMTKLNKSLFSKIVAITTFGDGGQRNINNDPNLQAPPWPTEILSKVKMNCVKGDTACDINVASGGDFGPHLQYSKEGTKFISESAAFIVAGFKGEPLPKVNNDPVAV